MSLRIFAIILDGLGVGALPDAAQFGDGDVNTLAHLAAAAGGVGLPALESLGLGRVQPFCGMDPARACRGAHGRMAELSRGKDSTTGHWELAGLISERPFPLYPDGFPAEILAELTRRTGFSFLGNEAASGTEIIARLGAAHLATGRPIVYTSADSVFQIAAHESVLPPEALYGLCLAAREILAGPHAVSRVIARPFVGEPGSFQRSLGRRDFSLPPPADTVLDRLLAAKVPVIGVGKVCDLFAQRGFTRRLEAKGNVQGMSCFSELVAETKAPAFCFMNLVDFDMLWGHRRDPGGYADELRRFDAWLAEFMALLGPEDRLLITADHGNDPTAPGSDHTREFVPVLGFHPGARREADLGARASFCDFAATLSEAFGLTAAAPGLSFWREWEESAHG